MKQVPTAKSLRLIKLDAGFTANANSTLNSKTGSEALILSFIKSHHLPWWDFYTLYLIIPAL